MEHEYVVRSGAVERYIDGTMTNEEEDAFEEHFFECPTCAEDVRCEQVFLANARAYAREQSQKRNRTWLKRNIAVSVGLSMAVIVVVLLSYLYLVDPAYMLFLKAGGFSATEIYPYFLKIGALALLLGPTIATTIWAVIKIFKIWTEDGRPY